MRTRTVHGQLHYFSAPRYLELIEKVGSPDIRVANSMIYGHYENNLFEPASVFTS